MADDVQQSWQENAKRLGEVIIKAWSDEGYLQRLREDPGAVLDEAGVVVGPGVRVEVHEDSDEVNHLVIPVKPADMEVSDFQSADSSWCWSANAIGCF
jgi:hypothetical protein